MKGLWFEGPAEGVPVEVTPLGKVLRLADADGRARGEVAYEGAAVTIGGTDGFHLVLTHGEGPAARALYVERAGLLPALDGVAPEWFVSQVRDLQAARRARWVTTRSLLLAATLLVATLLVLLLVNLHALAVAAVPVEWEVTVGQEAWEQLGPEAAPGVDPAVRDLVERTTRRLVDAHARSLAARGEAWPYTVHVKVARASEVNAFALPGGYLIVNDGLVAAAASPEEVAGVIAHELGHVAGRHAVRGAIGQLGTLALIALLFDPTTALTELQPVVSLVGLKNSRDHEAEAEADAFGARLLHAAGLDASGMSTFFERLARRDAQGPGALALLETHPPSAERAAALRALLDALPPLERGEPLCPADAWAGIKAAAAR